MSRIFENNINNNTGDPGDVISKLQNAGKDEAKELGTLGDMIAQIPLSVRAGRRAPNAVSFYESAKHFGVDKKPILFINTEYPRNLRQNSLHTVIMVLKPTEDARQPDMGKDFRFRAMICFQRRYKHYVCFVARDSMYGHWLLFNDLPGLEGRPRNRHGKPLDLESWHDVADTCARHGFTPTLLLYVVQLLLLLLLKLIFRTQNIGTNGMLVFLEQAIVMMLQMIEWTCRMKIDYTCSNSSFLYDKPSHMNKSYTNYHTNY